MAFIPTEFPGALLGYYIVNKLLICESNILKRKWQFHQFKFVRHRGLNKIADILQTMLENASFKENICILIEISLMYVPRGPTDNESTLVLVKYWSRTINQMIISCYLNLCSLYLLMHVWVTGPHCAYTLHFSHICTLYVTLKRKVIHNVSYISVTMPALHNLWK